MKQKKRLEALQSLTRDEPETCRPWILRLRLKKLLNKITWLDSWRSTSRTWPSHVGERVSKQNCVLVLITHRKQCVGVKKSRWRLLRTILRRRGQFFDIHFQTSRCLMQRSLPPWRRSSEMRTSKKGLSGRAEDSKKNDRFLCGRQIAFMIYEHFRVTGSHVALLDYSDLFGRTLHGDDVQGFDTRWDEALLSIQRVPSDDFLESLKKCANVGLIKSKPYWHNMNKILDNITHNRTTRNWRPWCQKNLRPAMKESRQEHQRNAKGNQSALMGSKESAINGKQKDSAQEETLVVFATMRTNVENHRAHPSCSRTADKVRWEKFFERKVS